MMVQQSKVTNTIKASHQGKPVDVKENSDKRIPDGVTVEIPQDMINSPNHYVQGQQTEVIDLVCDLPFWKGNAIKYIFRAGEKDIDATTQDLEKAQKYIEFGLRKLRGEPVSDSLRKFIETEMEKI